jgi:hypothetical protein
MYEKYYTKNIKRRSISHTGKTPTKDGGHTNT